MWPSSILNKKRSILPSQESSNKAPEQVEGNEDLLMIILVLLPARSIFRFRCVSKRWNNVIYTPLFYQTYYNIKKAKSRMLAYIQATSVRRINMLPVPPDDHCIDTSLKLGHIYMNSSNGLILYQILYPVEQCYIINPLTNKSVSVPPHKNFSVITLVCEENARDLVLRYKVIAYGHQGGHTMVIDTFSPDTCEWITSKLTATRSFDGLVDFWDVLVADGIIHWYTHCDQVAVYDSNQDKKILQLIPLPPCTYLNPDLIFARSSRNDPLWVCEYIGMYVKIWMLPYIGNSLAEREWVLMHNIDCLPLCETIILKGGIAYPKWWANSSLYTKLAGLVPWDSPFVVLLKMVDEGLIYRCNLESMTYEQVQFRVSDGPGNYVFHPCMEPLCLSTYAF